MTDVDNRNFQAVCLLQLEDTIIDGELSYKRISGRSSDTRGGKKLAKQRQERLVSVLA